jgi:hypothetical protein
MFTQKVQPSSVGFLPQAFDGFLVTGPMRGSWDHCNPIHFLRKKNFIGTSLIGKKWALFSHLPASKTRIILFNNPQKDRKEKVQP